MTMRIPEVIAIFDIGRTNKKRLLFDRHYRLLEEQNVQLPETVDEDGFPAEDLSLLSEWVLKSFNEILSRKDISIKAVNVSAYGASLVHLDGALKPVAPLYNYLKPFPPELQRLFNRDYDGEGMLAKQTASPELGNLNSGMQLYRLKKQQPSVFRQIRYSLHLPQYISFLISGFCSSDLTSIGCHTRLWNFEKKDYHQWVDREELRDKFAPIHSGDFVSVQEGGGIPVGIGLHDSSAALIPYQAVSHEPFILLSTGTWSISLNPFNHSPLTEQELKQDCLCYLSFEGKPVKASRLFAGHDHELFVKKLAEHFRCGENQYAALAPDQQLMERFSQAAEGEIAPVFRGLRFLDTYEESYHAGMVYLMRLQKESTELVLGGDSVKKIFVDGGFSRNPLFMQLMARSFPHMELYAASLAQASGLGAALSIHRHWNKEELPQGLPDLVRYAV
jgi:sugar (pentulose or hexulose) kinase